MNVKKDEMIKRFSNELDKGNPKKNCSESCKNYMKAFDHRSTACVLSDVYSVPRGEPCSLHTDLK